MSDDPLYVFRCQRRTRKGGAGFVVEGRFDAGQCMLRKQTVEQNEDLWVGRFGRINPSLPHTTTTIPHAESQALIDDLTTLTVPLLPPISGGFGGTDYTLTIHHADALARFSWWLDCPHEWREIEAVWSRIVALVDA